MIREVKRKFIEVVIGFFVKFIEMSYEMIVEINRLDKDE